MFDAADAESPHRHLMDAGFYDRRPQPRRSRAAHRPTAPTVRSESEIAEFEARRKSYDRRTLPKQLGCAPKGGRLLCTLEKKFTEYGFSWCPVIRSPNNLTVPFGHNSDGYAVLTENNAKIIGDRAPVGTLVTVVLENNNASLHEITVRPDGAVEVGRLLYVFYSVVAIDVECTNKPTFNGQNVSFEDLYHQRLSIFDPPPVAAAG